MKTSLLTLTLGALLVGCVGQKPVEKEQPGPKLVWKSQNNGFKAMYEGLLPGAVQDFKHSLAAHGVVDSTLEGHLLDFDIHVYDRCLQKDCRISGIYLGHLGYPEIHLVVDPYETIDESSLCHEWLHLYEHMVLKVTYEELLAIKDHHFFAEDEVAGSIIAVCQEFLSERVTALDLNLKND